MNPVTRQRRTDLAEWLHREHAGAPYTISEIVDLSGIYDGMQGRYDKCRNDLLRLRANGVVRMWAHARPSAWEIRE